MKYITLMQIITLAFVTGCVPVVVGGAGGVGTSAVQERSVGGAVDDTTIHTQINSLFIQDHVDDLFHSIGIEVHEGRVLLTGAVKSQEHRIKAVSLAWKPEGVKEVINEIEILDEFPAAQTAKDTWITTQLKSKLLFKEDVRSINYTIATFNGVVYLLGVAQDQEELDLATDTASKVKGVRKVVSHVKLKDDPARL